MKRKTLICGILYYPLSLLLYAGFFFCTSLLFRLSGQADDLGAAMALTYGVLFIGTPIMIAVLMRFSLLRWYVDPIAAAEVPLFLYLGMIASVAKRTDTLRAAFLSVNADLADDGGMGWLFLGGLFLLGLILSASFARMKGKSVGYRVVKKIFLNKRGICRRKWGKTLAINEEK
jgi:hypothetical protein